MLRRCPFGSSFGADSVPLLVGGGLLLLLTVSSCANPVPPSGGPRDTTPPSVVQTSPERDAVNVSTNTEVVHIEFSEYIERGSLSPALSVTPAFEERPTIGWSGRSVEIELPETLRDSTTYIFTIDTNLSDAHGVSLEEPLVIAFSTGPRINQGQIQGEVVDGRLGQPEGQVDIYAYGVPDAASGPPQPLPDAPSYRTQTGEDGTFAFDYMREQPYYVIALRDNNRNRQPDVLEPYAVPPRTALWADSGATEVPVPWLLTRADTVAPELQRVQALSRARFRVSFNEPVQFGRRAPEEWAPQDTTDDTSIEVQSVYADPDRADAVIVRTVPMEEKQYRLALQRGVVTDSLGRAFRPDTARFQAPEQVDTTRTRFRGFLPESHSRDSTGAYPLLPGDQVELRFNQAPDSTTLQQALAVEDTTGQPRGYALDTDDGVVYSLQFDPSLEPGQFADVTVDGSSLAGPDTTYQRRVRRMTSRALGEIEGQVVVDARRLEPSQSEDDTTALWLPSPFADSLDGDPFVVDPEEMEMSEPPQQSDRGGATVSSPIVVELTAIEAAVPVDDRRLTVEAGSTFVFDELPEGQYQFRAYLDRNENERWDGGRLQPYEAAEPVTWTEQPVEGRPRWTTELGEPLRLPVLAPGPILPMSFSSDPSRTGQEDVR